MFNIGFSEMVLIGVAALIFLPPEKLPGIATQLGRFIGGLTRQFNEVKTQVEQGIREEVKTIKKNLPTTHEPENDSTITPRNPGQPPR